MDAPDGHDVESTLPSFGAACHHCNKPDRSNMTWQDGVKDIFSTYFATPRMWPVGYILDSPYSPLHLERAMPSRNWRDAFEDLLALETGGDMIRDESRKAEDDYAAKERFEMARGSISISNHRLRQILDLQAKLRGMHQKSVKNKDPEKANTISEQISLLKAEQDSLVTEAEARKSLHDNHRNSTASSLKPRGQWIASLVTSGALPNWQWTTCANTAGLAMIFARRDAPPELAASISTTELELEEHFEKGQPYQFGMPSMITLDHVMPLIDGTFVLEYMSSGSLNSNPDLPDHPMLKFKPSRSSVLQQDGTSELVKLQDGSLGVKVTIENGLASRRVVSREFVEDPAKVLEEVENARKSMEFLRRGVSMMINSAAPTGGPLEQAKQAVQDSTSDFDALGELDE